MPAKPMPVPSRVTNQEAGKRNRRRLPRLEPWSRSALEKAYRKIGSEWDALEEAAVKAQGRPDFTV
jgi:hypothetical protein